MTSSPSHRHDLWRRIDETLDAVCGRVFDVFAPAKVNLRLKVEGRRPDGYHLLSMFNANLSIGDSLSLSFTKEPAIHLSLEPVGVLPAHGDNLVSKAFRSFWRGVGFEDPPCGFDCRLVKRIPIGGGLGGGSADAGAMLRTLAQVFGRAICEAHDISEGELHRLVLAAALQCGADVPYAVVGGPCWVSGIGEVVTPVSAGLLWDGKILIMVPRDPVPTIAFYARYRESFPSLPEVNDVVMRQVAQGGTIDLCEVVANDFESTAVGIVPVIGEGLHLARRVFPRGTALTGSGSVFFSLVPSGREGEAEMLRDKVAKLGISTHLCSLS